MIVRDQDTLAAEKRAVDDALFQWEAAYAALEKEHLNLLAASKANMAAGGGAGAASTVGAVEGGGDQGGSNLSGAAGVSAGVTGAAAAVALDEEESPLVKTLRKCIDDRDDWIAKAQVIFIYHISYSVL